MKTCEICLEEFSPKRANSRFCDKEHYRPCRNCSNSYLVKKVVKPPEFCSASCSAQYRNNNQVVERNCQLCGDSFVSNNANAKFCSKTHTRDCLKCGINFEITNLSRPKDFCSQVCSRTGKSINKKCKRCEKEFVATSKKAIYCDNDHYSNCELCDKQILNKEPGRVVRFCSTSCSSKSNTYIKICKRCNKSFNTRGNRSIYCSNEHTNNCVSCGKEYIITDVYFDSKTCSQLCSSRITDYNARNEKSRLTLLEKYGVENSYQIPHVVENMLKNNGKRISKINRQWKENLDKALGISFDLEKKFSSNGYADLKYKNVFVDINPTISHNSINNFLHIIGFCSEEDCNHRPKEKDYHHNRFLAAESEGKTLLQYFDWYDEDKFLSIVRSKLLMDENKIGARKTKLKEIKQSEANKFFEENHLLGRTSGQTLCLGLFYNEELVHCQTYGPARFNKNYEWEAIRSASKMNWFINGGFSKCDKYFFNKVNPKSVVSYVDLSISTGATELMFPGWELVSTNKPSATWVNFNEESTGPKFIKDRTASRISADRLLGFEVGEKYPEFDEDGIKITNDDVLLLEGYVKVFDAGTRTFGWKFNG